MPEAFNVFDAQVAQQRLQAGITTLVSSKEVGNKCYYHLVFNSLRAL
jgi:hypothetical protein